MLGAAAFAIVRHQPDFVQRLRYPLRYEMIVRGHAENYDLDPSLLAAVIYTESRFDAKATSSAGAIGLMQLLPETARGIAVRTGGDAFVVDDLYVPELNVRYGAWYLRNLLDRYGDERTALAAYHAGQGNVDRWRAAGVGNPVSRNTELRRQGGAGQEDLRRRLSRRARTLGHLERRLTTFDPKASS